MSLTKRQSYSISRYKVKHIERSDQLFLTRMMLVAEQRQQQMKSECCEDDGGCVVVRTCQHVLDAFDDFGLVSQMTALSDTIIYVIINHIFTGPPTHSVGEDW